ncbi:MAG TPA: hypothetical protein VFD33_00385 [Bacillota bacterium]|nr:hypothetical protein [Bacillota bacterium]
MEFGRRNQINLIRPHGQGGSGEGSYKSELVDERYHVYVNDSYVGDKISLAQGDGGPYAVGDYLKSRGFNGLDIVNEEETITISTQDNDEAADLKRHLSVYLNIR